MWFTAPVQVARYCRSCGEALAPDAVFCAACGTATAYSPSPAVGAEAFVAPGADAASGAPAGYGQRIAAWALDCVIVYSIALVVAVTVIVITVPDGRLSSEGQTGVGLLIGMIVPIYSAILHRVWHGQTIGKNAFGIAVRRMDGTKIGLGRSFARSYARAVAWVFFPLWVLDSLWPLWERKNRTLHDLIAETVVIAEPRNSAEDVARVLAARSD
jgi:uncharacterized RDD family membrane protein YckC